jgi:hypothetical protein
MTWPHVRGVGGDRRDSYFFLSYAHSVSPSVPLPVPPDTDYWVGKFYRDLATAVEGRAGVDGEMAAGFFDGLLDRGVELRQELTDALSVAHVFVPLYSPNYFGNAWAIGERTSFQARLGRLSAADAARHILPVLWIPLPPWDTRPEIDEALNVVGKSLEYAENGLRALCKLSAYREQYGVIVATLAERIVQIARTHPLRRSRAATLGGAPPATRGGTALVVSVLTATGGGTRWRPYARDHALPVADYVAATAERLGLPTSVVDFAEAGRRAPGSPTVLLIDPAVGADAVRAAIEPLPRWVVPLVVAGGDERGAVAAGALTGILQDADLPDVDPAHEVDEFERIAPLLVTEARKQFLKLGPVHPPAGPGRPRPSLRHDDVTDRRRGQEENR